MLPNGADLDFSRWYIELLARYRVFHQVDCVQQIYPFRDPVKRTHDLGVVVHRHELNISR